MKGENEVTDIADFENLQGQQLRVDGFFRGTIERIYLEGSSVIIQTNDGTILAMGE